MYCTVVTICNVQCSHYVPYSGQYMYRIVVIICTVVWSQIARAFVIICTEQWLLYEPYCSQYMYLQWSIYVR
jgi:hypothetical protein